ncbi:MAG: hypothetical protein ACRDPY_16685 [Streptosporangiaceae bacterium]
MHLVIVTRRPARPARSWPRALPALAWHVMRTMPWVTLLAGCAAGTGLLAVLACTTSQPLGPDVVGLTFLPAVAALAFVPRDPFRPVAQAAPAPAWLTSAGQILLAAPVLAVTCWGQLRLMDHTAIRLPAVYPLIAELTGWCALTTAAAAACDRSRYADLGGAIAAPVSLAVIALARYAPGIDRLLVTPPASAPAVTIAWYIVTAAALAVGCAALRDRWQRYTRRLNPQRR